MAEPQLGQTTWKSMYQSRSLVARMHSAMRRTRSDGSEDQSTMADLLDEKFYSGRSWISVVWWVGEEVNK